MLKSLLKRFRKPNPPVVTIGNRTIFSVPAAHAYAPEILAKIENDQDLTGIPTAFWLLLSDDPALKIRAARGITYLVRPLPILQLAKLDSLFRERTSLEWVHDWRNEDPANLIPSSLTETEKTIILGLASFHPNGYFREKAIKALSHMNSGAELPYLFIRLNDWVEVVRNSAKTVIMERLIPQNAREIINNLPFIFRLRECERHQHHNIVNKVIAILSKPEVRFELELGLQSKDGKIRRYCYQLITETKIFDNVTLLEHILKESLPMNRLIVLQQIRASLTPEEFQSYHSALLKDKFAPVRVITLELLYQFNPSQSIQILEQSILDVNFTVRQTARYLLGKHGTKYDFPLIYRNHLLDQTACFPGAIAGLGETGQVTDAKFIIPFLRAEKVRVIRFSLHALAKLDFTGTKDTLISLLADPRPGVVKEARLLLYRQISIVDAELIYKSYFKNRPDHLRRHTAILLCSLGKWDALPFILEICADETESVSLIGQIALSKWQLRYNRSFTALSQTQLEGIQAALKKYQTAIPGAARHFIEFTLKAFILKP